MMKVYCKIPSAVLAIQYDGSNAQEVIDSIRDLGRNHQIEEKNTVFMQGLFVSTKNGPILVNPGDWVIENEFKELACCGPDEFDLTHQEITDFEPVEAN